MMSKLQLGRVVGIMLCFMAILAGTVYAIEVGSLTGTASRAGGLGLAGADVFLFQDATQVAFTSTDYSGSYTFGAVPFGNYNLKIYVGANELYSGNVTVTKAGTTTVPTIAVSVVGGVIWGESFEYVAPGQQPLGHSSFNQPGGVLSTTVAFSGSNSWELAGSADVSHGLRTISVPAVAGKTYTASAQYTMIHSGAAFYLEFQDANRKRIKASSVFAPKIAEGTWGTVEHSDVAPEGTKYVATILYYARHATWVRTTYFDDVKIVEEVL